MKPSQIKHFIVIFFSSIVANTQAQQYVNCNNLYLDTTTFYVAYPQDTVISGNLFYQDSSFISYPTMELLLSDTSIIASHFVIYQSTIGIGSIEPFSFPLDFKTTTFPNNTIVNGHYHIIALSAFPILDCYLPISIILQNTTGINESPKNERIKIYPNAVVSELNIQNNGIHPIQITLYNTLGEKIIDEKLKDKTNTINLSVYSSGIYFYKVSYDMQVIKRGKIIKQ